MFFISCCPMKLDNNTKNLALLLYDLTVGKESCLIKIGVCNFDKVAIYCLTAKPSITIKQLQRVYILIYFIA